MDDHSTGHEGRTSFSPGVSSALEGERNRDLGKKGEGQGRGKRRHKDREICEKREQDGERRQGRRTRLWGGGGGMQKKDT